jgi:hypothetical protein
VGEFKRHSLYARLEEILGHENADTLMTSLSTQGTQDLATRLDIDRLEGRLDSLESKLDQQIRTYTIFGVIVSLFACCGRRAVRRLRLWRGIRQGPGG